MNQDKRHGLYDYFSPAVVILILANLVFFIVQSTSFKVARLFGLWPWESYNGFELWQLVTYGFLHASKTHLLLNMFGLWMFGTQLEKLWGTRRFLLYYFVCLIGAGIVHLLINMGGYTIGASGAVFGLLLGFGMMYPNELIFILFFPIPVKAKYIVVAYGLIELYLGVSVRNPGIAHFVHLGGMVFGFFIIQFWRGRLPWKPTRQLLTEPETKPAQSNHIGEKRP